MIISASLTIGLAITKSLSAFEAISFLVGVFSVVPQILIPFAADHAPPDRKAGAIAIVLSALMMGILIARVLSGIITNYVTFRVVYYMAIGLQFALLLCAYLILPNYPASNASTSYFRILWTMGRLALTKPLLILSALLLLLSNACFTSFWVTLTYLLLDAPYRYSTYVYLHIH